MPLNSLLQFQVQRLAGLRFLYITALFSLFFSNLEPNLELGTRNRQPGSPCSQLTARPIPVKIPLNPFKSRMEGDMGDLWQRPTGCSPKCPPGPSNCPPAVILPVVVEVRLEIA